MAVSPPQATTQESNLVDDRPILTESVAELTVGSRQNVTPRPSKSAGLPEASPDSSRIWRAASSDRWRHNQLRESTHERGEETSPGVAWPLPAVLIHPPQSVTHGCSPFGGTANLTVPPLRIRPGSRGGGWQNGVPRGNLHM